MRTRDYLSPKSAEDQRIDYSVWEQSSQAEKEGVEAGVAVVSVV